METIKFRDSYLVRIYHLKKSVSGSAGPAIMPVLGQHEKRITYSKDPTEGVREGRILRSNLQEDVNLILYILEY